MALSAIRCMFGKSGPPRLSVTTPHAAEARRGICLSPFTVDGHAVAVATLADRSVVGTVVLRPGVSQAVAYDVLTL